MNQSEQNVNAYPLNWPAGRPRSRGRSRSRFKRSGDSARRELQREVHRLGGTRLVISTNQELRQDGWPRFDRRPPTDPGVAVYFHRKAKRQAFACDKWTTVGDNLWAITKTLEALRGIERWGTGDMVDAAFTGFLALPAAMPVPRRWWEVLGVDPTAVPATVEDSVRRLRMETHPDRGGSTQAFQEVEQAWESFKQDLVLDTERT
jgi:hypothetical protein